MFCQCEWSIYLMLLGILINWDQLGNGICVHWHQYFFLKYNLYYCLLIKIMDVLQALMQDHITFMNNVSNVINKPAGAHVVDACMSVFVSGLLGEISIWCLNEWDEGVKEGMQSNTSKRKSVESHIDKPSLKVITVSTLSSCSLCACCTLIR